MQGGIYHFLFWALCDLVISSVFFSNSHKATCYNGENCEALGEIICIRTSAEWTGDFPLDCNDLKT